VLTSPTVELNVDLLPPHGEAETLLLVLHFLAPGESIALVADHDMGPLLEDIDAAWPGAIEWERGQGGPELWEVVLGRRAVAPGVVASDQPAGRRVAVVPLARERAVRIVA
jgi:uncharacterized protein (DUF2249 family)